MASGSVTACVLGAHVARYCGRRDGGQSAEVCLLAWAILERCLSAGPQQFQDALTLQHSSFTDWASPAQDLAGVLPSTACIRMHCDFKKQCKYSLPTPRNDR